MIRHRILELIALLIAPVSLASAADGWGDVTSERVADGVYLLRAQGGNIGALIGEDGILLIDDQFAPLTAKIRAALDALPGGEGKPVRFVLNTHFHGDHTGGNENFGKAGAVIVAHDNVRTRMTAEEFRAAFAERGGTDLAAALPVVTFNDRVTFHVAGHTLKTRHYAHAHTDGDSVVWFLEDNAVHMGDIYFQVGYPFIDIAHGGSVDGVIAAVEDVLAHADDDTIIIPGHGALSNAAELREYRDMLKALRAKVAAQLASGVPVDAVLALGLAKDHDARWSWSFISGESFVRTLYSDLAGGGDAHRDDGNR